MSKEKIVAILKSARAVALVGAALLTAAAAYIADALKLFGE